jgi:hypothetical protein
LPAVKFIDSYAFVNSGLARIVKDMKTENGKELNEFADLKKRFPHTVNYLKKQYYDPLVNKKDSRELQTMFKKLFTISTQKGIIAYSHTTCENMKSSFNLPRKCYRNELNMDLSTKHIDSYKTTDRKTYIKLLAAKVKNAQKLEKDYKKSNKAFDNLKYFVGDSMTYKDYFMYYLELDVLLLSDFFESFRDTSIKD